MTTDRPSTAAPVLRRALVYGAIVSFAIAVIGSVAGALVAELPGMLSALIGAGMGFVFLGLTAASILLADRVTGSDLLSPAYFGIVIGSWIVKFVVFLVLVFSLRDAPFVDGALRDARRGRRRRTGDRHGRGHAVARALRERRAATQQGRDSRPLTAHAGSAP